MEQSRADVAAAESRTAEYEQRIREARAAIFKAQEARQQIAVQARAHAVAEARQRAQAQVQAARKDIEGDKEAAKTGLQGEAAGLAREIVRRILTPTGATR